VRVSFRTVQQRRKKKELAGNFANAGAAWKHQATATLASCVGPRLARGPANQALRPLCLTVTVSHYPPGASTWNPVEHRLFSRISRNWQGEPLETLETVLTFIRTTTTDTGLKVRAVLNPRCYSETVKASPEEVESLSLKRHKILPQWNYILTPRAASK